MRTFSEIQVYRVHTIVLHRISLQGESHHRPHRIVYSRIPSLRTAKNPQLEEINTHLGGKMELRMSSVCDDCRSTGGAWPFFFAPLPLRLPVVLTSTGLSYLTRELWGGIIVFRCVVMPKLLFLLHYSWPSTEAKVPSKPNLSPTFQIIFGDRVRRSRRSRRSRIEKKAASASHLLVYRWMPASTMGKLRFAAGFARLARRQQPR